LQIFVLYSNAREPQEDTKIPSVPQAPNGWGYLACTFQVVKKGRISQVVICSQIWKN